MYHIYRKSPILLLQSSCFRHYRHYITEDKATSTRKRETRTICMTIAPKATQTRPMTTQTTGISQQMVSSWAVVFRAPTDASPISTRRHGRGRR